MSLGHKASPVTLSLIVPASHSQRQTLQWQGWSHILRVNEDVLKLAQLFTWFETSVRRPWLQGYRQRSKQMIPQGGLSPLCLSPSLPTPQHWIQSPLHARRGCYLWATPTSCQSPTTFRQLGRSWMFFIPQNGLLKLVAFQEVKKKIQCHDLKRKTLPLCKIVRSHCRSRQRPVVSVSWETFVEDFPRETQVLWWLFSTLYSSSEMGKIEWPSDHYL